MAYCRLGNINISRPLAETTYDHACVSIALSHIFDGRVCCCFRLVRLPASLWLWQSTGELVFVEVGECSAGELPHLLRSIKARFKVTTRPFCF